MSYPEILSLYQVSGLIEIASQLSRQLWAMPGSVAELSRFDSSRFIRGAFKKVGTTYLTPWFVVDLVYHCIMQSTDFALRVPSGNDFLNLYNECLAYDEKQSSFEAYPIEDRLFYMLFGLSQKTFWFQDRHQLLSMNTRFYEMLHNIPKESADIPQYYNYIEKKYHRDLSTYNSANIALVWVASKNSELVFPYKIEQAAYKRGVDNILIEAISHDYISDYKAIQNSTLGAKELYLTPIIRSIQNKLLIVSTFLVAKKAFANLYWETRTLMRELEGKELNQFFGDVFEKYVDKLLHFYLKPSQYQRLMRVKGKKRADLLVSTINYYLIVEQKFAMLNISHQDTAFDLGKVDDWLSSYIQACKQLYETESDLSLKGRTVIKLILFFDTLYLADALVKDRVSRLLASSSDKPMSLDNTFMISIGEFELLMQLIKQDEFAAEAVIAEKLRRQDAKDFSKGVEFSQIMKDKPIVECEFLRYISPFQKSL